MSWLKSALSCKLPIGLELDLSRLKPDLSPKLNSDFTSSQLFLKDLSSGRRSVTLKAGMGRLPRCTLTRRRSERCRTPSPGRLAERLCRMPGRISHDWCNAAVLLPTVGKKLRQKSNCDLGSGPPRSVWMSPSRFGRFAAGTLNPPSPSRSLPCDVPQGRANSRPAPKGKAEEGELKSAKGQVYVSHAPDPTPRRTRGTKKVW